MNLIFMFSFSLYFLLSMVSLIFVGILSTNFKGLLNSGKEYYSLLVLFLGFFIYSILGLIAISYNVLSISFFLSLFLFFLGFFYFKFFSYFVKEKLSNKFILVIGLVYILFFLGFNMFLLNNFSYELINYFNYILFSFVIFYYFAFVNVLINVCNLDRGFGEEVQK